MEIKHYYRPQRSWGKVIFSEACVKNSVPVGGMCGKGACMAWGMRGRGGGHAWQGVCMVGEGMHGRGLCVVGVHGGGHAWQGGMRGGGACVAKGHEWHACPPSPPADTTRCGQ